MTSPVSPSETIAKAMEGVTPGPWKRIAMGGSSTVTSQSKPSRNDTRIPSYGYRDEEHCLAYPFIEDDGRARWDFVCFSHADAAYISACNPVAMREVLDELYALRAFAEEAKADIAKYRRMAVDRAYMLNSYRNMLGPKGLEVAAMWERKGVTRQHTDWGPEAGKMTGEERAQALLDVEAHIPQPLDFADSARTLIQGEKK